MFVPKKWQELEELTFTALEAHGYECEFRKVFKNGPRYEIDVLARGKDFTLAFDCKHYLKTKSRTSALRREARKHFRRCRKYSEISGEKIVPILLTLLDDSLLYTEGCIVVPLRALNDFLLRSDLYLEIFSRANFSRELSMGSRP
jgi:hypothetical protein